MSEYYVGVVISIWSGISPAAPDAGDLGGVLGTVPPVVAPDLSCMLFIHLLLRVLLQLQ